MECHKMNGATPIQEFYRDKCVLITGGSGFMGKILLEKLLRSCPDVGTVYLLMRPKRGEGTSQRVEKLLQEPVFERLRRERGPGFVSHPGVVAVSGDISRPGLGLSVGERAAILSHVSVVFHVAATVRFNEKLKTALQTNLAGTQAVLQLCRDMQQLKALVYVSTAYSNSPRTQVDEVVYTPPVDPDKILQCMDWMSEEQFEHLAPTLLGDWPNTYTYSKMLAEVLVTKHSDHMPVSIFRPAIVISTHREPVAGWLDNLNGPAGITVGAQMGTLRCFQCDTKLRVDLVPVDMAANAMLATAWATASRSHSETMVYNFVSSPQRPITWKQFQKYCESYALSYPSEKAMWYYCLTTLKNPLMFKICKQLMHDIPARAMDLIPLILGKGQKMTKLYSKIDMFTSLMSYFTTKQWEFTDHNMRALNSLLCVEDRAIFPFDLRELRWEPFLRNYMAGIRLHLLKEQPDNLEAARKKYLVLYLLHRGMQLGLVYATYRFIMTISSYVNKMRKLQAA